jgi:ParB family chromosome partitioning protein
MSIMTHSVPINDIKIGPRFRHNHGDLAPLIKSIREVGLLHPIVVTPDFQLIVGARRLAALRNLDWDLVPITIVDLKDIVKGEYAENELRKDFTPSEKVAIAKAIVELESRRRSAGSRSMHILPRARPKTLAKIFPK